MEYDAKGLDNYKVAFKKARDGYADFKRRAARLKPPAECPPSPDDLLLGGDSLKNGVVEPGNEPKAQNTEGAHVAEEHASKSVVASHEGGAAKTGAPAGKVKAQ